MIKCCKIDMPCSICRFSGHNRSTCVWKDLHNSNVNFEKYIFTEEFYLASIKELLCHIYSLDDQINNIQDNVLSVKDKIDNYTIFNKNNYYVKEKKDDCTCVICMDECTEIDSCYQCNVCNVIFHQNCINNWFKDNKKTCPACRAEWGIKAVAPYCLINSYDRSVKLFEDKVCNFKKIENYMIDTLARYYNIVTPKNMRVDIISYVPNYMNKKSLEIARQIDMNDTPIMANGSRTLLNY